MRGKNYTPTRQPDERVKNRNCNWPIIMVCFKRSRKAATRRCVPQMQAAELLTGT